ncbi:MAG: DUF2807 domain-containing protein [Hyphomonadaceae bacterium]|nr:DUF2807 domain-containing protein [Hyphomonadaceae bacterium]
MLRVTAAAAVVFLAFTGPGIANPAASGPRLVVRGVAAQIQIVPEDRADYAAEIGAPGRLPAIELRREGQTLVLDGKLERRIRSCSSRAGGPVSVTINGIGRVSQAELPTIVIRAPREVAGRIANAGATKIGPARAATLDFDGCGDARFDVVTGDLSVELDGSGDVDFATVGGRLAAQLDGSGDVRGGDVSGDARLILDGSGDIVIGRVGGGLAAELDGSGNITVASVGGATSLSLDGSGNITVRGGTAPRLIADIDGSGNISFLGEAGGVRASIDGSGNIRVARATGEVTQSTDGSGRISIGR